jgi:hypothetical protein
MQRKEITLGLAVLTFVTTFAGLGPLVGMLTILRVKDKI